MGKFLNWLESEKAPDYSFDSFVRGAENLKSFTKKASDDEAKKSDKLDKDIADKKKEAEAEDKEKDFDPDEFAKDDDQKKLWDRIKRLAKRRDKQTADQGKDSNGRSLNKGSTGDKAKNRSGT